MGFVSIVSGVRSRRGSQVVSVRRARSGLAGAAGSSSVAPVASSSMQSPAVEADRRGAELRVARDADRRLRERVHAHDDALARRIAVVLGAGEKAGVPAGEVLVHA